MVRLGGIPAGGREAEQREPYLTESFHQLVLRPPFFVVSVSSVDGFSLPNPCGRGGGACTSTLLNVLYKDHQDSSGDLSFTQVMEQMRVILKQKNFEQIPQV
jgi:hypothetical protein